MVNCQSEESVIILMRLPCPTPLARGRRKSLNHRPEAAVAGLDEADIEVECTAQVSLGQHLIAGAVGQDIALAQNHATVKGGQNIFNALGNEDNGEPRVGGGKLIYGIEQELSPTARNLLDKLQFINRNV